MKITDQKPRVVSLGGINGKYFRCGMCGHRFMVGDYFRFVMPGSSGVPMTNFFTCVKCDGEDILERWISKYERFKEEFWYYA